jgi:hypothetical protein
MEMPSFSADTPGTNAEGKETLAAIIKSTHSAGN